MPRMIAEEIAAALKQRISAGEWIRARRIPPERDLARQFGVARNTIRRAVGHLEQAGIVARQVGRGTFLVANESALADIIARMEGASPADIMEVRQLLEPAAAAFAATSASAREIEAVEDAHRAACEADDLPNFERHDAAFHQRILLCSRNSFLREIYSLVHSLRNQATWFEMKKRSFSEERRRTYCNEHQAILTALLERDQAAAKTAMLGHLRTVARNLLGA